MKKYSFFSLVFFLILITGCGTSQSRSIYYWDGAYTKATYKYLSQDYDASEQMAQLEQTIQKAYEKGAKVPPGLYAHLGLLYSNAGNLTQANAYFEKEVREYPESREFIAFLLSDKNKKAKK
ncbi:hypothetical protein LMG7974_00042 [Campylobacter majalis]|uniref:DUF4810 domain-containing protein n=1 Tax=Campylobacter majalis TaxID=2790656 RepID=A0ABN7K2H3_9BACT|nr:DUF4810 domain-containing protein [Campylobacter majalis]CAD7286704.1 hypothetical protein LMG7974_00042 [Campylobacter majalis]